MQGRTPPLYNRGKYWLDKLRRADGSERSPRWYIFWYDPAARREASASAGSEDVDQAILALDRRYLSDADEAPAYCHACGQPLASAEAYLLTDAMADYLIEHGQLKSSADSIQARLKHVTEFLDAQETAGGAFGIPVLPILAEWLTAELASYEALPRDQRKGAGYLVNYYGRAVLDVDTSWGTMLRELQLPAGREWKPYLLRHSLATLVRNRGVAKWDLEGFMGHDVTGSTEVYAIGRFESVTRALADILGEIDSRAPGALRRNCAELAPKRSYPASHAGGRKITG